MEDSIYVVIGYFVTHAVGRIPLITQVAWVLITDTTFYVVGEARTWELIRWMGPSSDKGIV